MRVRGLSTARVGFGKAFITSGASPDKRVFVAPSYDDPERRGFDYALFRKSQHRCRAVPSWDPAPIHTRMSQVDERLDELKAQIEAEIPSDISVTDVKYEGPELVVYTRHPKRFARDGDLVRRLASKLRKRITIRPHPDVLSSPREAKEQVRAIIPEEAGVTDLDFHEDTGEVVIEAEKPGLVIGRHGSTLREITREVGWTPEVVRTPPIESTTVSNVRNFLTQEREERRDILERIGREIHREEMHDEQWVRVTTLGCCREVGRAAFILSTAETRILIDCPSATPIGTERVRHS